MALPERLRERSDVDPSTVAPGPAAGRADRAALVLQRAGGAAHAGYGLCRTSGAALRAGRATALAGPVPRARHPGQRPAPGAAVPDVRGRFRAAAGRGAGADRRLDAAQPDLAALEPVRNTRRGPQSVAHQLQLARGRRAPV